MSPSRLAPAAVVMGVGGVGGWHTHAAVAAAAQHWVQRQVIAATCGWQSTNKSRLSRPAHHG